MKLEEKLRFLRQKHGYSQEQLADKIGIARQTVSKWENCKYCYARFMKRFTGHSEKMGKFY